MVCHAPGNAVGGGLDLSGSATAMYGVLVGKASPTTMPAGASCGASPKKLVVASDSAQSLIYDKIATKSPSCGSYMPFAAANLLAASDIATIKNWIDQGANP